MLIEGEVSLVIERYDVERLLPLVITRLKVVTGPEIIIYAVKLRQKRSSKCSTFVKYM